MSAPRIDTHLPPTAVSQLEMLAALLQECAGQSLLGLILHGSAATSGFDPGRSDLDVLAVIDGSLTPEQRKAIGNGLLQISKAPHPLEFSIVSEQDLQEWSHPLPYQLHFGEELRERFVLGECSPALPGDEDLAAHVTVARTRGLDLLGGYPVERLPVVPRKDFLAAVLSDLRWAYQRPGFDEYLQANACRTMAYLSSGLVLSKTEGLRWCREHGIDSASVARDVVDRLSDELDDRRGGDHGIPL